MAAYEDWIPLDNDIFNRLDNCDPSFCWELMKNDVIKVRISYSDCSVWYLVTLRHPIETINTSLRILLVIVVTLRRSDPTRITLRRPKFYTFETATHFRPRGVIASQFYMSQLWTSTSVLPMQTVPKVSPRELTAQCNMSRLSYCGAVLPGTRHTFTEVDWFRIYWVRRRYLFHF